VTTLRTVSARKTICRPDRRCDPAATQTVEREVARGGEEQCLGGLHLAAHPLSQHAGERLLHDVVVVRQGRKPRVQPRAQHRFVRLHVFAEPAGGLGVGGGHGRNA
jgi:hypothetical protein